MSAPSSPAHWDAAYTRTEDGFSWYQPEASTSLTLIGRTGVDPAAAVIDVGGGASTLVDGLLAAGFRDLTVLDLSPVGLGIARRRLGDTGDRVRWLATDLLTWHPDRAYALWHDRAVLHFLTAPADRQRYVEVLTAALAPGGHAVIGTFAEDGPAECSSLPTARYTPEGIAALLGPAFETVLTHREEHTTPSGRVQPFRWLVKRARATA
jgi:SAM-dependent methyltransferase